MNRLWVTAAALCLLLTACSSAPAASEAVSVSAPPATATPAPTPSPEPEGAEVDLTGLSSTMVFAEVAAMVRTPEDYVGKTVRMQGQLAVYEANPALGIDHFYTVVIEDATACCQQGAGVHLGGRRAARSRHRARGDRHLRGIRLRGISQLPHCGADRGTGGLNRIFLPSIPIAPRCMARCFCLGRPLY